MNGSQDLLLLHLISQIAWFLGLVKKLGFVLAPARTRLARKQNAGLLVGIQRGQGWQGSKTQAYWLVVRVLLTPPAEAAASQKWKIIYL